MGLGLTPSQTTRFRTRGVRAAGIHSFLARMLRPDRSNPSIAAREISDNSRMSARQPLLSCPEVAFRTQPANRLQWIVTQARLLFTPITLIPLGHRHESRSRGPGAGVGTLPRVPGVAGPVAGRAATAGLDRPLRRGAADAAGSVPGAAAVRRPGDGPPGGVAAAHPEQQPGRRDPQARHRQTRPGPRTLAGGGPGTIVLASGSVAGGRPIVAQPASPAART